MACHVLNPTLQVDLRSIWLCVSSSILHTSNKYLFLSVAQSISLQSGSGSGFGSDTILSFGRCDIFTHRHSLSSVCCVFLRDVVLCVWQRVFNAARLHAAGLLLRGGDGREGQAVRGGLPAHPLRLHRVRVRPGVPQRHQPDGDQPLRPAPQDLPVQRRRPGSQAQPYENTPQNLRMAQICPPPHPGAVQLEIPACVHCVTGFWQLASQPSAQKMEVV